MLARIRSTVRANSSRGLATRRLGLRIPSRPGYTLLEVLLASAIGVLLMGALYVAMDVQLRHAQAGRELIEQGTLVRVDFPRTALV